VIIETFVSYLLARYESRGLTDLAVLNSSKRGLNLLDVQVTWKKLFEVRAG
jgi:hypothetical protein